MLKKLEQLFSTKEAREDTASIETATAALFVEMAAADFEIADEERAKMAQLLGNFFSLDRDEVDELIRQAEKQRQQRNDLWYFTSKVKEFFGRQQKIGILENLWMLIYADGRVDRYEDNLIRKITALLGLEHHEMIEAKLKAREK